MAARPKTLGKYELLARIAKGGMAEVYLARQSGLQGFSRLVVVKRILPHLAEEELFVQMFHEEARLAARIGHPNVVQIFDVGDDGTDYFIAMEYIDGPSVARVTRQSRDRRRPVPAPIAAEIIAQACDGLRAAHELCDDQGRPLGLVHRDVTPHNLMVTEGGLVKLVDFGIAKAQDTAIRTTTGSIKGKFPYMSPEQCRGDPLDQRSDLFSLGITFFELVTARRLFKRQTDLMTLKAITEEPIPSARDVNPTLSREVNTVISTALRRRADLRYPNAAEMAAAVRAAVGAPGETARVSVLSDFVRTECRELLDARASAIRQLSQTQTGTGVPIVAGFEVRDERETEVDALPAAKPARRSRARLLLIGAVAVVVLATAAGLGYRFTQGPSRPDGPPLRFGLVPAFPAAVVQTELAPLITYLEENLDRAVDIEVPADYRTLRRRLLSGAVHFANLPPLQLVLARHESKKLVVLATHAYEGARTYQGYLIVRGDSPIADVAGIRGKSMCYVDPGSTSGYLLPRQFLRTKGIDPDKDLGPTTMSGTHPAVMRAVVAKQCDVGAVYSGAFLSASDLGIPVSQLQIISKTGQLPYDVVVTSPHLPAALSAKLRKVLIALDPAKEFGRPTVGKVYRISGFSPVDMKMFRGVEAEARAAGMLKP